jgi:glutaminyl-peptide cyclotransferase
VWKRAAVLLTVGLTVGVPVAAADPGDAPVVKPTVIAEIPHDPTASTEGLETDGPDLYETTGINGRSQLRQLDPATGQVLRSAPMPNNYFGEGFAVQGDRILQLTYDGNVMIEWDKATFTVRREIPFPNAWGICQLGDRFAVTDGTNELAFYDLNLNKVGSVDVTWNGEPTYGLDETECVDGQVWAALWPSTGLARIDPATGKVDLVVETKDLWHWGTRKNEQVFSSLAHISGDEYFLIGKEWPYMIRARIDG